ncbi:MAG TPA: hypothetical protein PKZ41_04395 [Candidatus Omnitrophota bacterium]|nr:hypothetical protein [Candidatus Omnitrophota bacterium]
MGKMLSVLVGGIVLLLGLILIVSWWFEFIFLLKGVVPGALILGGLVAVLAGISEFKDTAKAKTEKK